MIDSIYHMTLNLLKNHIFVYVKRYFIAFSQQV